ncbi:MAG TPA: hypothetical protein VJL78_03275 [Candidatus Nitrosocosmicus sp.]|jgi:hypothetical protein|nr:hypothetical protein [Candidatus Nitrosocosmicus sp.]
MPTDYGIKEVSIKHTLDEAINLISKIFSNTERHLEIIIDHDWLCHLVENPSILTLFRKLKLRNIDIKIVIEIDKKNVNYSKRLMKFSDIRHSDNLEGCSFRNEHSYCFCHFSDNEVSDLMREFKPLEKLTQLFYIDNRNFVNQQDSLFKHLWHDSVSAREKITEIEKSVMEVILNHEPKSEIDVNSNEILFRIVESCVDQILILIPSTDLFWDFYNSNLLVSIAKMLIKDVTAKILIHLEDGQTAVKDEIRYKLKELSQDLDINTNFFSKKIPQLHISIIVDNVVLIEIDYKNEKPFLSKKGIHPLVSFSISDTRVSSSTSVFDILWIQSDFERQKKIKQTYFDIFKGFDMKSENYSRDWNFEKKSNK